MPEAHTPLITTIAAGLLLAYVLGLLAHRLRIQLLVGYLAAGILVGPFTPGFVANQELAAELAEIGVILLMFGVGLHFSLQDLVLVARIAIPGAVSQILVATSMGVALAWGLGWSLTTGLVFGLALSVASTVVLVRALQERRILDTERGRIAVGWLIVEDLAMVLTLVLLPAAVSATDGSSAGEALLKLVTTFAKLAAFVALTLFGGRLLIPWLMHYTAHTGSRELFRLAVYAVALGVAFGAAKLFGASFAVGAFFAGMVLGETKLSQRATKEAMPLRDAFAVLFFVSVGMLFNPGILIEAPLAVGATVVVIVFGKSAAAYLIVRAFGYPSETALTISASLAQIGEFSFILTGLGVALGVLPVEGRDLILAAAIISILLNPLAFALVEQRRSRTATRLKSDAAAAFRAVAGDTHLDATAASPTAAEHLPSGEEGTTAAASPDGHVVVVGYGRVGSLVGARLAAAGYTVLVVEDEEDAVDVARRDGVGIIDGNAADPDVLALADLPAASWLFVTIPEVFEAGQVVQQARAANPGLEILARAHSDECVRYLENLGATITILGEREIAHRMIERALPLSGAGL